MTLNSETRMRMIMVWIPLVPSWWDWAANDIVMEMLLLN